MDPSADAVGKVIRRLRELRGMSQKELAHKAEYQASSGNVTISNIERGKTLPGTKFKYPLARALGTTWNDILAEARKLDAEALESQDGSSSSLVAIKQIIVGKQKVQNEARASKLERDLADLQERHRRHVDRLADAIAHSREEFTDPFFMLLANVSDLDQAALTYSAQGDELEGELDVAQALTQTRIRVSQSIIDMAGTTAAVGAAGAGLGAAAAVATYSAVGAFATASTGTAIASLAGASATSATLAWLGGGSLAAGGAGIAGGTAVLSGILALPAIVAVFTVALWQGHKIRKQSEQEARTIADAEQQLADVEASLTQAWEWADNIASVTDDATLEGVHRLATLTSIAREHKASLKDKATGSEPASSAIPYNVIEAKEPGALQDCLEIATILLTLQALPIWSRVAELDAQSSPLDDSQSSDSSGTALEASAAGSAGKEPLRWGNWNSTADNWNAASIEAAERDVQELAKRRRREVSA